MNKQAFTPCHLLLAARENDFWKAYWNSADFVSYPHYIAATADRIKHSGAKRVFIISEDRAHFLAGFLAALYADLPVVLPQSDTPELLNELMQPGDLLLTDQNALEPVVSFFMCMHHTYDATVPVKFAPLDPEHAVVIFYTSGSTGKPKAVEKKLRQLEAEVEVLHRLWGEGAGEGAQGRFLSTVSHHHLYALLYSLLWPVCGGFKMERRTFTYWGDLLGKSCADDFLISSPAHLGRFLVLDECHPQPFRYTFSSGAPLSYEAAMASKKYLGSLPIEVYGSTETGGIAFRSQAQSKTPWQRFDCVELSHGPDHKLRVKSPYMHGTDCYQTEDQISWVDNDSFHLLGRADRVVKVEGKRVALSEIENKLRQSLFVAEAAVVVLERSYREELGAVIVLSEHGLEKLKVAGKVALTRLLRDALGLYFHAVVIPRKWRFIEAMAVNAQGKCPLSVLKAYFASPGKPALGAVRLPIILRKVVSESTAEYYLKIPHDLAYLEGHFQNMPIVPGVVQLHWAIEFAKADLNLQGGVKQGNQIKFTRLLKPNDEVCLSLEYHRDKCSVSYSYRAGELSYSSGRMTFSGGASREI